MNHVDCWQALTIWQSGMLWHGNWWKLPFAGRSSSIGDHDDNCLFDLGLKQLCPLTSPLSSKHLIGIPWQMHVVPVGYPVQSIGENGNYRDNRRRLSGWTLHQTTSYVGLFTSFSSVCLWQRWQIKTNSNDFARCPASSASNPCGASGGRRKVYFGRFTSSAWWDFHYNKCGEIFFFMLIMIIVIIMMKYHEMRSYCTITKQPEI